MARTLSRNFVELIADGVDSNDDTAVTASLDIATQRHLCLDVVAASGTHGTEVVTLQFSVDDSVWQASAITQAGAGFTDDITINARYVRVKVTTAEGGASTVDITIQAKP